MEEEVEEKTKVELEEGRVSMKGDSANATAAFARMSAKDTSWKERSEEQSSYLPPDYGTWTVAQVQHWLSQVFFFSFLFLVTSFCLFFFPFLPFF